jgi:hypothetical protein
MKKYLVLIVLCLASLALMRAAVASEADEMTYDQTVNYIMMQLNAHAVPYPTGQYQKGSRTYSIEKSQVSVITETSGRGGWTQKTVSTLNLPYLTGFSVNGGTLTLSVKEITGGVTNTTEHTAISGRETHEKTTSDRLDIEMDDYEVARRVGNAIKHLADLYVSQQKESDKDPFK